MHEVLTTSPITMISSSNRHQTVSTLLPDAEQTSNNKQTLLHSFKQENMEHLSSELLNDKLRTLNKQSEPYFLSGSSSNQTLTSNYMNEFNANIYSKMSSNCRSTPPSSASSLSINSTSSKTSSPTNNSSSSSSSNESNSEYFPHMAAKFTETGHKDKVSHSIFATIAAASNQSVNFNEQSRNNHSENNNNNNELISQYLPHQYKQGNLFQSMNASFKPATNQTIQSKLTNDQIQSTYSSTYNYYTRPYTTGNTSDFLYNQFPFNTSIGTAAPTTQLSTNTPTESLFMRNNLLDNTTSKPMKYDSTISSSCSSTSSSVSSTSSSILNHLSPINAFNSKSEYSETSLKLPTSSPTIQKKENHMVLVSNSFNPTSTSSSSSSSSFTASPSSASSNKILSPKEQQHKQDNSHLLINTTTMGSMSLPSSNVNASNTYSNHSNQGESFEWMKPVKVQSNGKLRSCAFYFKHGHSELGILLFFE